jgi:uncharacterized membrane protein
LFFYIKESLGMINWAHVHLIINHFPVVGVIGAILLLMYGVVRKSDEVKIVSLGIFVLLALITIPVFLTGEKAYDIVKNIPGVTEGVIGRHEETASYALVLMELLGSLALLGLLRLRRSCGVPKWIITAVFILSCITAVAIGFTANLGGQIRHTEIRSHIVSPSAPGQVK